MNRLSSQKSPYLLQHKNNPVDWYAWGDEAFEAAKSQNKPIFLSIGYSTCYWCHVMEKDCFEDQSVADALKKDFISIKLDREERPDIDQIYMDAVVGITGHGGWPMSVFLTPKLKPFFGGTYFPKVQFVPLLEKIGEVWREDQNSLLESSKQLEEYLLQTRGNNEVAARSVNELLKSAGEYLQRSFDSEFGGFGGAPKFPQSSHLALLFRLARRTSDQSFLKIASFTLEKICRGGVFDHLGGGMHRYAVDRAWNIPHFEKMLYDNAQLVSVLVEAYKITNQNWFLNVAKKTSNYVLEVLENSDGAFFAAEDAGEVGREGEFYIWKAEELKSLLSSPAYESFKQSYDVRDVGNFEHGTNILNYHGSLEDLDELDSTKKILLDARNKRNRPFKDRKIITSWNGLMLSALCKVASVTDEKTLRDSATKAADFILTNLFLEGELKRRYCDGESEFDGVLEDYSFLIQGLLDLHQLTGETTYFESAVNIQNVQNVKFWDSENGGYYFSASSDVITRKKDYNDGATPSGNSVSALNLLRLNQLTGKAAYKDYFTKLKAAMLPHATKYPGAYTTFLCALDYELENEKSVVVSGASSTTVAKELNHKFLPNTPIYLASELGPELLKGKTSDKLQIYVCSIEGCSLPTDNLNKILTELEPAPMDIS